MSQIVKVKTGNVFEDKASYSRVVAVDDWIFVSNTAGRNPDTKEIPNDIEVQIRQVFTNIERALRSVDASLGDAIMSRVFIQNPEDTDAVMAVVGEKFRGINPATTVTCPPLGSTIYKVELELTAFRGASKAKVKEIMLTQ
ncbi:MAG: RidA family protein [Oceanospirillales bacterium]|nr:MAG: RidA family protein [Oceanospirillales bacterium]